MLSGGGVQSTRHIHRHHCRSLPSKRIDVTDGSCDLCAGLALEAGPEERIDDDTGIRWSITHHGHARYSRFPLSDSVWRLAWIWCAGFDDTHLEIGRASCRERV